MDELERNNYAELCGTAAAPPALSHENRQERFFTFPLETQRLSGTVDRVNVIVRERLLSAFPPDGAARLCVTGDVRSFNNRRGPGVLQEYRDILKLLGRQSVGPDASGWVFRLTPYVMVGVMLTIATALPVVTVDSPLPVLGDLITLIYLFAIARFFFAISGLDTGSPFTALGSSREAMLGVLVEPILLLGLWVAAQVAGSTHISTITDTLYHWPAARSIPLILALCACAFATFIEMGKLPFDLAEAEQELQEGPLSEYSGSGFGILKWGISLKQLVVLQMFVGVFFPWGQMTSFSVGGLLLALVVAVVKLVVGVLIIALFENSMARLRFCATSRVTWAGFGFAFLAFVSLLVA